jgi:hypothetical protein
VLYNRRTVKIIEPPALSVATVEEMKDMLVIVGNEDDNLLLAFIEAATEYARQYLRRSIVTETLEIRMDGFPGYQDDAAIRLGPGMHTVHYPTLISGGGEIDLPFGPVASIVSIATYGRDGAETIFDPEAYDLGQDRIYLREGNTWPINLRRRDAVVIRYTSGTPPVDVPLPIRQGIKQHVLAMYECREGCEMPPACKSIMAPYRRMDDLGWY